MKEPTEEEMERGRRSIKTIMRKYRAGTPPMIIGRNLRLPKLAIQRLIAEGTTGENPEPASPSSEAPAAPATPPTATAEIPQAQGSPFVERSAAAQPTHAVQRPAMEQGSGPYSGKWLGTAGMGPEGSRPEAVRPGSFAEALGGGTGPTPEMSAMFPGGDSSITPAPGALSGVVAVPDEMKTLYMLCRARGISDQACAGIIFWFGRKDPDDYEALRRIIIKMGITKLAADAITEAWQDFNDEGDGDDNASEQDKKREATNRYRIRKGLAPIESRDDDGFAIDPEEKDLIDREAAIARKRRKAAVEAEERELASGGGGHGEKVPIIVNIGGYPMTKYVSEAELPMWRPYIAAPGGTVPGGTDPEKDALKAQVASLLRQQEMQALIAPIQAQLTVLTTGGGSSKQIESLQAELRGIQEKAFTAQRDQLANQVQVLQTQVANLTNTQIQREQIQNQHERDLNNLQVAAGTKAIEAAAAKVTTNGPVRNGVADLTKMVTNTPALRDYVDDKAREHLEKKQNDPVNKGSEAQGPTSDQVAEEMKGEQNPTEETKTKEATPPASVRSIT